MKHNLLRIVVFFLFWVVFIHLQAQSSVNFDRYSTLNGLPQNSIFSIAQDDKGFIWVATYDGISRFDGSNFISYKPDPGNQKGLSSNITVSLTADNEHKLWVGTTGSGFSVFDIQLLLFENYQYNQNDFNSLSGNDITSIVSGDEHVWVGTSNGLNLFNKENSEIISFYSSDGLLGNHIYALLDHGNGQMWVSTASGIQLISFENEKLVVHKSIENSGGIVRNIYRDMHGRLWLLSQQQVICIRFDENDKLIEVTRLKNLELDSCLGINVQFNVICQRAMGEFWIGTQSGLLKFTENGGKLNLTGCYQNNINDDRSLPGNQIISLFTDDEGVLWIGTRFSGLGKFNPYKQHVTRYMHNPSANISLHSNDVRTICEDADGNIWVGSRSEGLDYINLELEEVRYFESDPQKDHGLRNNGIRALYLDEFDNLWVGYWGGFARIEKNKGAVIHFVPAKDNAGRIITFDGTAYAFYEDSKGDFWVGTSTGLLLYNRKNGNHEWVQNNSSSLPLDRHNFIRAICEDNKGNIWLATDGSGVYCYNRSTGLFKNHHQILGNSSSLAHNKVYAISYDIDGSLWFATHSGLSHLNLKTDAFTNYSQDDGLSNNIVYGIIQDRSNRLWLPTANGLSQFNKKSKTFKTFISGFEFSDDAVSVSRDGRIYAGGLNGFFAFHPDSLQENHFIPPVRFTNLRLFNQTVEIGEEINGRILLPVSLTHLDELVLNHYDTFFSIEFAALSYASPSQNQYQFKLDGLHTQWINTDQNNRIAVFTQLSSGSYSLRVRGANSDGYWGETVLRIKIIPAFYQTNWFKWAVVLFFTFVVYLLYSLRLRSLTQQKLHLQHIVEEKTIELQRQNLALSGQKDEIARQHDQVVEMTRLLREVDERKLHFFTGISHEIRTPLTLILGPLEQLLTNRELPLSVSEKLKTIEKNAKSLLKLVGQLLDFRKIDTGYLQINLKQGDLKAFLHEKLELFQPLMQKKSVQLSIRMDVNDLYCFFDEDVVEKVMFNLLSNAIKYTPVKGRIDVAISLKNQSSGVIIWIEVANSGPGIPVALKEKIFERFFRINDKTSQNIEGAGIGLALSRDLARLHGGDLILDDNAGSGSCFAFWIPFQKVVDGLQLDGSDNSGLAATSDYLINQNEEWHEATILVVEDNDDLRGFIISGLQGYQVLEARNGDEGIKMALEHIPDLILSDILMPGKNGFEVCREAKCNSATSHIPVILLTALGSLEHQQLGFDTGADDYIVKPFNLGLLTGKVRNILKARLRFREQLLAGITGVGIEPVENVRIDPVLNSVLDVINQNLSDPSFGVEELGNLMNMSRSTFYRKIKSITGISPVELIRSVRITRGSELLKENPKLNVNEIAFSVGFEDVNYFRDCFKKQFGSTPTSFCK